MNRIITDQEALDQIANWFVTKDPLFDEFIPNWVWDFVIFVEDRVMETGRDTEGHN